MIRVEALTFYYEDQQIPIFSQFNWEIAQGETCAILGPSGCGKTTLLYLLSGLRNPTSGNIYINHEPILRPRPNTGLILQDYGLLPWATVKKNIQLGLEIRNFYGPDGTHAPINRPNTKQAEIQVTYWLENLGLVDIADKYPQQISGGQRQRTAIARTMVLNPDLLLMDEPFSSLDAPTRESLQNLTYKLCREQGITLVVVTHSIEEAAFLGEKILLLSIPPNLHPQVFVNPGAGGSTYRAQSEYQEMCRLLRQKMVTT
jgi:ABC-type nitrate/sulfonate/bicarbonate transport system ATPase subunit